MSILTIACTMSKSLPTEKQCKVLIQVEERLKKEGFYYEG
jgi:hypothetical protein